MSNLLAFIGLIHGIIAILKAFNPGSGTSQVFIHWSLMTLFFLPVLLCDRENSKEATNQPKVEGESEVKNQL